MPLFLGDHMLKQTFAVALVATMTLAGCASAPKDIAPAYVSTGLYENLSCPQLRREAEGVSSRMAAAYGKQTSNQSRDAAMTGVSLILFWPAAFFLKGDGADAAEVARLKGEMTAIDQVNRVKNCGIQFSPAG